MPSMEAHRRVLDDQFFFGRPWTLSTSMIVGKRVVKGLCFLTDLSRSNHLVHVGVGVCFFEGFLGLVREPKARSPFMRVPLVRHKTVVWCSLPCPCLVKVPNVNLLFPGLTVLPPVPFPAYSTPPCVPFSQAGQPPSIKKASTPKRVSFSYQDHWTTCCRIP